MLYEKFDKDNNEAWVTPDLGRNVLEILIEGFLFNEVLKKLDFFHLPIKKVGFITRKISKQILKAYLWLIYRFYF